MKLNLDSATVPAGRLVPKTAVIFYGNDCDRKDEGIKFATRHNFVEREQSFSLEAGTPLTLNAIKQLAKMANKTIVRHTEILSQNVLMANDSLLVWWRPAAKTQMVFDVSTHAQEVGREALQGAFLEMPLPALVFALRRGLSANNWNSISVFALSKNERPDASSEMFRAPLLNVEDDGNVCWGDGQKPSGRGVGDIVDWEKLFFSSKFTHYNGTSPLQSEEPYQWIADFCSQNKDQFPIEVLKPMKKTLITVVKILAGGDE